MRVSAAVVVLATRVSSDARPVGYPSILNLLFVMMRRIFVILSLIASFSVGMAAQAVKAQPSGVQVTDNFLFDNMYLDAVHSNPKEQIYSLPRLTTSLSLQKKDGAENRN